MLCVNKKEPTDFILLYYYLILDLDFLTFILLNYYLMLDFSNMRK